MAEPKESLVDRLRKRAAIRRKATCRGSEDRLAKDLDEAADALQDLERQMEWWKAEAEDLGHRPAKNPNVCARLGGGCQCGGPNGEMCASF